MFAILRATPVFARFQIFIKFTFKAICRGALEKWRRTVGQDHGLTLTASSNLAVSLLEQVKHVEAAKIQREVLVFMTRLLGADHENTLISATNLAVSLCDCGLETEAGQLLRNTLALCRRALGPTHERTQHVLQQVCSLGCLVTSRGDSPPVAWGALFCTSGCLAIFLIGVA